MWKRLLVFLLRGTELSVDLEDGHLRVELSWNGSLLFEYTWRLPLIESSSLRWQAVRRLDGKATSTKR